MAKGNAIYRTSGEQVGHLMFRKSGFIREHERKRLTMHQNSQIHPDQYSDPSTPNKDDNDPRSKTTSSKKADPPIPNDVPASTPLQAPAPNFVNPKFSKEDIQSYEEREAKEFFSSKEELAERE